MRYVLRVSVGTVLVCGLGLASWFAGAALLDTGVPANDVTMGITIEVFTEEGFRPLNYSIVPTATPVVGIEFAVADEYEIAEVKVLLTGSDYQTDITGAFQQGWMSPGRRAEARIPVRIDSNTISVTVTLHAPTATAGTPEFLTISETASMLNYDDDTLVVSARPASGVVEVDGVEFAEGILVLNFDDEAPLETASPSGRISAINELLRRERLRPVGNGVPIQLIRAEITSGEDPLAMACRLACERIGILQAALPDVVLETHRVAGEDMPAALRASYRSSAGARCTGGSGVHGCFDFDGPDDTNQLRIHRYHFLMDTFAGHRLVQVIRDGMGSAWRDEQAGLAIIDSGLGNGIDPCGGPPPGTNPNALTAAGIPCRAIFNVSDLRSSPAHPVIRFDANGIQTTNAGAPVALNLDIGDIADRTNGHGTSVTAAAAARGTLALGIGKDVRIRPIRHTFVIQLLNPSREVNFADEAYGVLAATRDAGVDVINTSFGWNEEVNRKQFRNARIQVEDASVDVVAAARAAEKIWVASLGNTGDDVSDDMWPATFAPHYALRHAASPLVVAVGSSELRGTETTQPGQPAVQLRGPEQRSGFSNFGKNTSVVAPGGECILPDRGGSLRIISGTSFAAPAVAGLAAEMIYLDRNMRPADERLTPHEIIVMIETTADDLGKTYRDPEFGNGRINVWKALLSVANGGLAKESPVYIPDSLRERLIDHEDTDWYGFRIITSVFGATVWLNDDQLLEARDTQPNPFPSAGKTQASSKQITAYRGVRSDQIMRTGVPGEDPTSGVVPVGNSGGEYVMTFSIEQDDLVRDPMSTLSLRRPDETAEDAPFFQLAVDKKSLELMRSGIQNVPGVVFDDFVFEITPPDFGDAPLSYPVEYEPSRRRPEGDGARHLNSNLEWFGRPSRPQVQSVSPEQNPTEAPDPDGVENVRVDRAAQDLDRYDDGVVFYPLTYAPGGRGIVEFTVCVSDPLDSGRYNVSGLRALFVNGWIDWDTNGQWEEGEEHVIDGLSIVPTAASWRVIGNRKPSTTIRRESGSTGSRPGWTTYRAEFDVPATIGRGRLWARFRLDYRQDVGRTDPRSFVRHFFDLDLTKGAARFGEVEDYLIGSDFGDAPDNGTGNYPTRKSSQGARHLDIYGEWLQDARTREINACLSAVTSSADEDTHRGVPPNLGDPGCLSEDHDIADEASVSYDETTGLLTVTFTVQSSIASRGYDLMGLDNDGDGKTDEDPHADNVDEDGDGKDGEDGPDLMKVTSSSPSSPVDQAFDVWSTPPWSGGRGRYYATEVDDDRDGKLNEDPIDGTDDDGDGLVDEDPRGTRPLVVNIFVDWNQDQKWDTSTTSNEWVARDRRIAPETFGKDHHYTLGEPFKDVNHNGVWDNSEPIVQSAGIDHKTYTWKFKAPVKVKVPGRFWVRIRLSYAELSDGTIPDSGGVTAKRWIDAGVAHATEASRRMSFERGGALFGEVEDYVLDLPSHAEIPGPKTWYVTLGPDARSRAMGGAFVPVVDEAKGASAWRPAMQAHLDDTSLVGWPAVLFEPLTTHQYVGVATTSDALELGLGWERASRGFAFEEEWIDLPGEGWEGDVGLTFTSIIGSLSTSVLGVATVGANVKYYLLESGFGDSAAGFGFDLGLLVNLGEGLVIGGLASDVGGTKLEWDGGATDVVSGSYKLGLTMNPAGGKLVFAADIDFDGSDLGDAHVGAELKLFDWWALRGGVVLTDSPQGQYFTVGTGIGVAGLYVDAAYSFEESPEDSKLSFSAALSLGELLRK